MPIFDEAAELGTDTPQQLATLIEAGLYDPDTPTARDRLQLLGELIGDGCTIEEMLRADARGRLFALAGDRVLRPGRDTYTLREVADLLTTEPALIHQLWRALGLRDVGLDTAIASPADVSALPVCLGMRAAWGDEAMLSMARTYSAAMDRIAHAEVDATRPIVENLSLDESGSEAVTGRSWAAAAKVVPQIGGLLDMMHRHHLENASRRAEQAMSADLASRRLVRQAVGFVDLCGFTALSQTVGADTLAVWLSELEARVYELAQDLDGRVVKFLGDAAMIVAARPAVLADILTTLVGRTEAFGEFRVRAGAAYGEVLAQDGDYFGAAVNLAARLVAEAEPATIMVSPEFADLLEAESFETELLPARELRGFHDSITPYHLRRVGPVPMP